MISESSTLLLAFSVFALGLILWYRQRFLHVRSVVDQLRSEKKGTEVKLGQVSEQLAPLFQDFPVDTKKSGTSTVFLGKPVDYLHVDPERGVFFVEVKSGNARLSSRQRKIRDLIDRGEVHWLEYRVSANGGDA